MTYSCTQLGALPAPANDTFATQPAVQTVEAVAVEVTASPQNGEGGGAMAAQAAGAHPAVSKWTPEEQAATPTWEGRGESAD